MLARQQAEGIAPTQLHKLNVTLHIDDKNIKKHKNDVFRLTELVDPTNKITVPSSVYADIQEFVQRMQNESVDMKQLGLVGKTKEQILKEIKEMYTKR